jgi:hypothetical protein
MDEEEGLGQKVEKLEKMIEELEAPQKKLLRLKAEKEQLVKRLKQLREEKSSREALDREKYMVENCPFCKAKIPLHVVFEPIQGQGRCSHCDKFFLYFYRRKGNELNFVFKSLEELKKRRIQRREELRQKKMA